MQDDDFKALEEAMDFDDSPPEESEPQTDDTDTGGEPVVEDEQAEGDSVEQEGEPESSQEATPEESETPEPAQDDPSYATKDDVIAALREYNTEQSARVSLSQEVKNEIAEKMFADALDTQLYFDDGTKINTAQDLVDAGVTDDYEEAARWILENQQQKNKNKELALQYAEEFADTTMSLKEGQERVEQEWGDVLAALPEDIAGEIEDAFIRTLVRDENTGIVTKAPVDIVQYYNIALRPYLELAQVLSDQQQAQAEAEKQQAEATRDERSGLPRRGESKAKPNTGNEDLDALMEALEG